MNSTYVGGRRQARRRSATSTSASALAVDVEKDDGGRTLLVPVIRDADTLDFRRFWQAYEELIRKVRTNKSRPTTSPGPPSPSPTPARSAPSSRCPG